MKLSSKQKILIAAYKLSKKNFSSEELVVKTWELFNLDFGLEGFTDKYPNSNKVYTLLMGRSSIIEKENWLEKIGHKMLSISISGMNEISRIESHTDLVDQKQNNKTSYKEDSREVTQLYQRFLSSGTVSKILNEEKEFSYIDACDFWNIPQISNAQQVNKGLIETSEILDKLENKIKKNKTPYEAKKGKKFTLEEILEIKNWHIKLQKEFSAEIEAIKKRKDQRKY